MALKAAQSLPTFAHAMPILRISLLTFAAAFLAPLAAHAAWWLSYDDAVAWHRADWSSAGILPPARAKPDAAVYVFAARTGRWKGIFAHHSWIIVKERDATRYTRFDKVAWGRPVKINNWAPDARWYGHTPMLVAAIEGPQAEPLVVKIKAAVARYPLSEPGDYSVWPGPNSNSFIAYVLAAIPEAGVVLPPTAIGKDWRVDSQFAGLAPSRTGVQLSLGGFFGITFAWVEGLEINVLGLVAGLDIRRPALKLPGFGRIGLPSA
ncbi:MAG: DUF3750 domain-containing protein [Hyphomonadaceae bacterium]|nr:DUF3750 domain-containing protein [Hyphomonadaceae bacterium]